MKLLFITHLYPPYNLCGSEIYIHQMIKALQARGHECWVLKQKFSAGDEQMPPHWIYDGVDVYRNMNGNVCGEHFRKADRVICQLHFSMWAVHIARHHKKPVFHITHNHDRIDKLDVPEVGDVRIIYNSETSRRVLNYQRPSIVFHPIIRKYSSVSHFNNDYITLINLNENKGAPVFYEIAKRMWDRQFLAVKGTYGEQILSDLPNVTIIDPQEDMSLVYDLTRIVLIPSREESYCMVAAEAMTAGIPVIASPTAGLRENCGSAAIWVDREDIDGWIKEIKTLDSKKSYLSRSEICSKRVLPDEISQLETFITW